MKPTEGRVNIHYSRFYAALPAGIENLKKRKHYKTTCLFIYIYIYIYTYIYSHTHEHTENIHKYKHTYMHILDEIKFTHIPTEETKEDH